MDAPALDDVDAQIIAHLREDARHTTNAEIADRLDVSASTVGNRLDRLEAAGIVRGYRPVIDFEQAGFPLRLLFRCTAPLPDRVDLARRALEIDGAVHARVLLTGERNVHVRAVGQSNEDLNRIASRLGELGLTVADEVLTDADTHEGTPPIEQT